MANQNMGTIEGRDAQLSNSPLSLMERLTYECVKPAANYPSLICLLKQCHHKLSKRSQKKSQKVVKTSQKLSCVTTVNCIALKLTNRMWLSMMCTLIDNNTRHYSGQNDANL